MTDKITDVVKQQKNAIEKLRRPQEVKQPSWTPPAYRRESETDMRCDHLCPICGERQRGARRCRMTRGHTGDHQCREHRWAKRKDYFVYDRLKDVVDGRITYMGIDSRGGTMKVASNTGRLFIIHFQPAGHWSSLYVDVVEVRPLLNEPIIG